MDWKRFLRITTGKLLMTAFFLLVPIPLPAQFAAINQAKYTPLIFFPFLTTQTVPAYFAVVLTIICFYVLSSLISNVYHKFVLRDLPKGDFFE